MGLQLYRDGGLERMLPRVDAGAGKVYRLELPRNRPGGVVVERFYVYNDSVNPVEDLRVVCGDESLQFTYPRVVGPRGVVEVAASWKAPVGLREALTVFFSVTGDEVARPRL